MAQTDIDTLHSLNVPIINFKKDKKLYDKIVKLVEEMLFLNKHSDKNKEKIKATDSEIDDAVYKLYDIGEKDRKVIEHLS